MENFLEHIDKVATLFISVCALGLTIYQIRATHRHNKLSVKPALATITNLDGHPSNRHVMIVSAYLNNHGLGPATIKKLDFFLDDEALKISEPEDLNAVLTNILGEGIILAHRIGLVRKEHVMKSDDSHQLTYLELLSPSEAQLSALKRIHVRVIYESAYGDSFEYDSRKHML